MWRYQIHPTNPAYRAANSLLNDTAAKSNAEKCAVTLPLRNQNLRARYRYYSRPFPLPATAKYLVFFIMLYDKRIEDKSHEQKSTMLLEKQTNGTFATSSPIIYFIIYISAIYYYLQLYLNRPAENILNFYIEHFFDSFI